MDYSSFGTGFTSFPAIVAALLLYYGFQRLLQRVWHQINPDFYAQLQRDRKDARYFAFVLGIGITMISTPTCTLALLDSSDNNDNWGHPHVSSGTAQLCVASRAMLWVSELNRLDHSNGYVYHHVLSLADMISHLQFRMLLRPLFAIYASLVTEIFSNLGCILAIHGLKAVNSSLARKIQTTNTLLLLFLRIPAILYAGTFLMESPGNGMTLFINVARLSFYARFMVRMLVSESKRLQIFKVVWEKPAHLVVCKNYPVYLYTLAVFTAILAVAATSIGIFAHTSPGQLRRSDFMQLGFTMQQALLFALIGARIPSLFLQQGITGRYRVRLLSKTGYWLQGGILGAIISMMFGGANAQIDSRFRLLAAFLMSVPLGEAIGRVGCYFSGCCGRTDVKGIQRLPTQLISSALNLGAFLITTSAFFNGFFGLPAAATLALGLNALIRMFVQPLRRDSYGRIFCGTSVFATMQLGVAIAAFLNAQNLSTEEQVRFLDLGSMLGRISNNADSVSAEAYPSMLGMGARLVLEWLIPLGLMQICNSRENVVEPKFKGILQACSSSEESSEARGILQACSSSEESSEARGILQACSSSEEASEARGILQACSSSEESSEARGILQACSSSEESSEARGILQACSSSEESSEARGILQACSSSEESSEARGILQAFAAQNHASLHGVHMLR